MREESPVHFPELEKQNPGGFPGASSGCSFLSGKVSGRDGCGAWWEHAGLQMGRAAPQLGGSVSPGQVCEGQGRKLSQEQ